jgi:hypothetical protein
MGVVALWVNYPKLNNIKISFDDDNCNAHMSSTVVLSRVRMQLSCILFVTSIVINDEL